MLLHKNFQHKNFANEINANYDIFDSVYSFPCRDLVVECLDDRDDSIRLRALDLIAGMVSKKNLMEITKKLISHMDDSESASCRDEVLSKIILICSQNNYQYITNFEW